MTSLNLARNTLVSQWNAEDNDGRSPWVHTDGRITRGNKPTSTESDFGGIIAIANAIPDMRALTKFDISNCNLRAEGGKALAVGLKGNHVMTELNVAGNLLGIKADGSDDTSGIIAIADAIPDMGALTKFDISNNTILAEGGKALAEALKGNQVITELSAAGSRLAQRVSGGSGRYVTDMSGVTALADAIPDMGALTKVTFGDRQMVTMTTEMTEANFGGKLMSHEAQIVAAFLPKCT
jgi:hypothetical protein